MIDAAIILTQSKLLTVLKKNNVMLSDYKTYFDDPVVMFLDH